MLTIAMNSSVLCVLGLYTMRCVWATMVGEEKVAVVV